VPTVETVGYQRRISGFLSGFLNGVCIPTTEVVGQKELVTNSIADARDHSLLGTIIVTTKCLVETMQADASRFLVSVHRPLCAALNSGHGRSILSQVL
jgi:hypothetical protein